MFISHSHRFVVLAPWKTASSTMHLRLKPWNESPYSRLFAFNPHLNRVVHQHLTCAEFLALPESRLGYFRAAFVRNPYDRVYSGFRQIQKDIQAHPHLDYSPAWIGDLVREQLAANEAQLRCARFEIDAWVALLGEHQVREAGHNISLPLYPAHYWTHVDGQQVVDFIGRVESFESDFAALCARIGIEAPAPVNENVEVVPNLEGSGSKYAKLLNSASIRRINQLFQDDFALFGYTKLQPDA